MAIPGARSFSVTEYVASVWVTLLHHTFSRSLLPQRYRFLWTGVCPPAGRLLLLSTSSYYTPLHLLLLHDGLHGSISSGIACHPWLRWHHRHLASPPHRQPVVSLSSSPSPLPSISSIVAVDESPKSLILTSTPADSVIAGANPPPDAVTVPSHHTPLPACSCGSATTFVSVSTTAMLPTPSPPSPPRI
jgi:hypothetical protein